MTETRRILIVGGGPAGTYAAIAAKKQDPSANVVLLTDEPCEPYEKPPLSKAVLLGKATPQDALIAGPAGVVAHGVVIEHGARCIAIERADRNVLLADGRRLPYDALVLATGAVLRQIPHLPQSMPGVHYLRNAEDAHALKSALAGCNHLIVVGGGLIGLEAAASAAELGVKVTVLEVAPRILARVCYAEIGDRVHAAHEQRGVNLLVGTSIASVQTAADGKIAITTTAGETLTGECVLVGIGTGPDDALAAAAGLAVDDGIIVDEQCRTSDPAIYAAGDAVRFPGPGGPVRLENWRHALDQGTIAGKNAAGAAETYSTVPSFWSEQYDLYIQGIGWATDGETVSRPMNGNSALSFRVRDGRLTYALGINAQRDLSMVRRLMERRIPVDAAALADPAQPFAAMLKRA